MVKVSVRKLREAVNEAEGFPSNRLGKHKEIILEFERIRKLKYNPLWLHVEKCARINCNAPAEVLWRKSIYLCENCYKELKKEVKKENE